MQSLANASIRSLSALATRCMQSAAIGAVIAFAASSARAADPVVTKLASGLKGPCAIAVQPDSGSHTELFVGVNGTGRVIRLSADHPDTTSEAITGFPERAASKPQGDALGITSLFFVDHSRLLVAGGGDQGSFLKLYEIADSNGAIGFDDQKQNLEDSSAGNSERDAGTSQVFHSIARTRANDRVPDLLLLAGASDTAKGRLWKIPLRANTLSDIAALPMTGDDDRLHSVNAVAVASTGYVTIATTVTQNGESHVALCFLDPTDGRVRLTVPVDLQAISGLAYNPVTGDLFAAGQESDLRSGVYRLDNAGEAGKPFCKAKKIASFPLVTALAFAPDSTLYVTALDESRSTDPIGTVFKITGF